MRYLLLVLCIIANPAFADIEQAVDLTKTYYESFEEQALILEEEAVEGCRSDALIKAYHNAFDAWIFANVIQFGPVEDIGGALSISFWPDKKGFTTKALERLIQKQDVDLNNIKEFSDVSVAAKGFMTLELMLFDPAFTPYSKDEYGCDLIRAITRDIANKANRMNALWQDSFAEFVLTAGSDGNTVFLSENEAAQVYFTSILGALEFIETVRLARPLGTLDRQRPKRAEAWRSNRSLRNIELSLRAVEQLVIAMGDNQTPMARGELSVALSFIPAIKDESFQSIADTDVLFKVQSLQQMVTNIKEAVTEELSQYLGVTSGFNALDGD